MTDEPIVCNAGPLIALSIVGHLGLLEKLYRRILVPDAVIQEVVGAGAGRFGAEELEAASWIERVVTGVLPEPLLTMELGRGEAAVISTAHQLKARLVLIDERRARRVAEHAYGLRVKGSAGILISAKRAGLIPRVRPLLESMSREGYFLSARLIGRALEEAEE